MTFRDLMALFNGIPDALNQMKEHLRNFARERINKVKEGFNQLIIKDPTSDLILI
jgi:hypothetical protein